MRCKHCDGIIKFTDRKVGICYECRVANYVTKTEAKTKYLLKDEHLEMLKSLAIKVPTKHAIATMYPLEKVNGLSFELYGDLDQLAKKKEANCEDRKRRLEADEDERCLRLSKILRKLPEDERYGYTEYDQLDCDTALEAYVEAGAYKRDVDFIRDRIRWLAYKTRRRRSRRDKLQMALDDYDYKPPSNCALCNAYIDSGLPAAKAIDADVKTFEDLVTVVIELIFLDKYADWKTVLDSDRARYVWQMSLKRVRNAPDWKPSIGLKKKTIMEYVKRGKGLGKIPEQVVKKYKIGD